jgi:Glyoxalase superfamily protein
MAREASRGFQLRTCDPLLRIFDIAKADEFYLGFLGFKVDWDHRFDANAPLYRQVSRDGLLLRLSEHHGDGSPGARIRVMMRGIEAFHQEISAKGYRYMRPGLETTPWGMLETGVIPVRQPDPVLPADGATRCASRRMRSAWTSSANRA